MTHANRTNIISFNIKGIQVEWDIVPKLQKGAHLLLICETRLKQIERKTFPWINKAATTELLSKRYQRIGGVTPVAHPLLRYTKDELRFSNWSQLITFRTLQLYHQYFYLLISKKETRTKNISYKSN